MRQWSRERIRRAPRSVWRRRSGTRPQISLRPATGATAATGAAAGAVVNVNRADDEAALSPVSLPTRTSTVGVDAGGRHRGDVAAAVDGEGAGHIAEGDRGRLAEPGAVDAHRGARQAAARSDGGDVGRRGRRGRGAGGAVVGHVAVARLGRRGDGVGDRRAAERVEVDSEHQRELGGCTAVHEGTGRRSRFPPSPGAGVERTNAACRSERMTRSACERGACPRARPDARIGTDVAQAEGVGDGRAGDDAGRARCGRGEVGVAEGCRGAGHVVLDRRVVAGPAHAGGVRGLGTLGPAGT